MNSIQSAVPIIIVLGLLVILAWLVRYFWNFSLRVKIVLGILLTGGAALSILAFFAINRTAQITNSLSQRLDTSVSLLAEEQLINTSLLESQQVDQFFNEIKKEIENLVEYRISLQSQKAILSQGAYSNAATSLTQLDGGQYGNSPNEMSSIFVPVNIQLNEAELAELNISAYLDFLAPKYLRANSAILAIYAINPRGVVRYYPNINLASLLPADFDATERPYYKITTPLFNPQRSTRWAIPYVDATGGGLVVTAASPVYIGNTFNGIIAADIQLSRITEKMATVKIGQTGYAFMIDDAGRIVYMPPAGYEMFGIKPEELLPEEFFKQTVLGTGTDELKAITRRMAAGGNGLNIVQTNGVETYISYSPVKSNGYSIALVVPVSEMQGAIAAARAETQSQIRSSILQAISILIGLLVAAILISFAIGQIISAPVIRLTQTANQIVNGDITAQATINSNDEVGILARAFNTMTTRLREILEGLEQRVEARTFELRVANEKIERRAKQFESIAQVARTISSTQNLDNLLTQIATVINREYGFYHVGIFLLDNQKQYAILRASNSEGGLVMLKRGHRLKVGEQGIVGFVTLRGEPRIALDVGQDAVFFDNPDLPNTRSELALPLKIGAAILGALDLQSIEENAFSQEDMSVLVILADQVAIAIQNAYSSEQARHALMEAEIATQQLSGEAWRGYAKRIRSRGYRYDGVKAEALKESSQSQSKEDTFSVPVKLRGQMIGRLKLKSSDTLRQWTEDELALLEATAERLALALDGARLLDDAQKRAARESFLSDIGAKLGTSFQLDSILRDTVEELGQTLQGSTVSFQLINPSAPPKDDSPKADGASSARRKKAG